MMGASTVLDFGGACGLHYKLVSIQSPDIRWAVVETPAMVKRAAELATDKLQFFTSIDAAADWLGPVDVMHSNGALQYTQLCGLGAQTMVWDRVYLGERETEIQVSHLANNGPGPRSDKNCAQGRKVRTH
jgi:putative methyltransferase (TIGR04325 family)